MAASTTSGKLGSVLSSPSLSTSYCMWLGSNKATDAKMKINYMGEHKCVLSYIKLTPDLDYPWGAVSSVDSDSTYHGKYWH